MNALRLLRQWPAFRRAVRLLCLFFAGTYAGMTLGLSARPGGHFPWGALLLLVGSTGLAFSEALQLLRADRVPDPRTWKLPPVEEARWSDRQVCEALGFMSVEIPELHAVEVSGLVDAFKRGLGGDFRQASERN